MKKANTPEAPERERHSEREPLTSDNKIFHDCLHKKIEEARNSIAW